MTYTYTLESGVRYGVGKVAGGGTFNDLLLDLYIPDVPAGERLPLIVLIHGGGFTGGDESGGRINVGTSTGARIETEVPFKSRGR